MNKIEPDTYTESVICPTHGEYIANVITVMQTKRKSKCPECLAIKCAKEDEENRKKRALEILSLKKSASIPPRFKNKSFDSYQASSDGKKKALAICQKYAESYPQRLEAGGGMVLCGGPGTGKTHLAISVIDYIVENYAKSALFTSVMGITKRIKKTYSANSSETEEQAFKIFANPSLLVIDELGVQFGTDTEKLILFEIINYRYEHMLPTILISNLALNELMEFAGDRIIDRMQEGGGAVISFDWSSYRQKI